MKPLLVATRKAVFGALRALFSGFAPEPPSAGTGGAIG